MNMQFSSHACTLESHTVHLNTFWVSSSELPNFKLQTHPQHSTPVPGPSLSYGEKIKKNRLLLFIAQHDAGIPSRLTFYIKYTTCSSRKFFKTNDIKFKKSNFITLLANILTYCNEKEDCKSECWSEKLVEMSIFFVVKEMPTEDKAAGRRAAQRRAGC